MTTSGVCMVVLLFYVNISNTNTLYIRVRYHIHAGYTVYVRYGVCYRIGLQSDILDTNIVGRMLDDSATAEGGNVRVKLNEYDLYSKPNVKQVVLDSMHDEQRTNKNKVGLIPVISSTST